MNNRAPSRMVLALAVALSGCHVQEYVVPRDGVPLFATEDTRSPAELLGAGEHDRVLHAEDGLLWVRHHGMVGYVRRGDVRIVDYLDPSFDDGADRDETVSRAVREVLLRQRGAGWPPTVSEAVLAGRVLLGMTGQQVETAWGKPTATERLGGGRERWIFRRASDQTFVTITPSWSLEIRPRSSQDVWYDAPFYYVRLPVTEERVLELEDGRVTRYCVNWYPGAKTVEQPTPRVPEAER